MTDASKINLLASKVEAFAASTSRSMFEVWNIPGLSKADILKALRVGHFETTPSWDGDITDVVSGKDETDHGKNTNRFPFHTDGVYYKLPPQFVILYCQQTGGTGGETFFTLAMGVIEALRKEFNSNLLNSMQVVYMERDGKWYSHPLIEAIGGTEIMRWSSALYLRPDRTISEPNRKRFAQILPEIIAFINRTMEEQICYKHTWHVGDVVIWRNDKSVHGRTEIHDPNHERHLYRVLFNSAGQSARSVLAPQID